MRMYDLITKKRNGGVLSPEEIAYMVEGYTKGDIPDYQMSAMMMAIYFQGMTKEETLQLTLSMARCKIEDSQAYPFKSEDERYNGIYYGFPITAQTNVKKAHEYLFGTKDYKPTEELQKISAKIKVVTDYIGITE